MAWPVKVYIWKSKTIGIENKGTTDNQLYKQTFTHTYGTSQSVNRSVSHSIGQLKFMHL